MELRDRSDEYGERARGRRGVLRKLGTAAAGAAAIALLRTESARAGHDDLENVFHLRTGMGAPNRTDGATTALAGSLAGPALAVTANSSTADGPAIFADRNGAGSGNAIDAVREGTGGGAALSATNFTTAFGSALLAWRPGGASGFAIDALRSGTGIGSGISTRREDSGNGDALSADRSGSGAGSGASVQNSSSVDGNALTATRTGSAGGSAISATRLGSGIGAAVDGNNSGAGPGVRGTSALANGVEGHASSDSTAGVRGFNAGPGIGVDGQSVNGKGVSGTSQEGIGVSAGSLNGVAFEAFAPGAQAAIRVFGHARFSTVGSGMIPARSDSVFVPSSAVTAGSHITVALTSDPGNKATVQWIERAPGSGFTVHLSDAAKRETPFTYFIVQPTLG